MKFKRAITLFALLIASGCANNPSPSNGGDSTQITQASPTPNPQNSQSPEAQTLKDLSYASASSSEKLDLYIPAGIGPFPVVVYVHGGGFRRGDKQQPFNKGIVDALLKQGYAIASLNYRLSGEAHFPAAVQDEKAAVRWLRTHAQEYRLDSKHFAAWGDSAGGNLVSILGTSCGVSDLEGADLGNADQSSCVQAVVDWYGPMDFLLIDQEFIDAGNDCPATHLQEHSPESDYLGYIATMDPAGAEQANPITYITPEDPPVLIQHGSADCTVPPQQSQLFYDALAPVIGSQNVTLTYFDGWEHGDPRFTTPSNIQVVMDFLNQRLK